MKNKSAILTALAAAGILAQAGMAQAQSQDFSNAVMALNPVAYWPLTENVAPAASAPATVTNRGSLGAALDGALVGNVVAGSGPLGNGADLANVFDAVSADVLAPYATDGSPAPPFTIELWANAFGPADGVQCVASDFSSARTGWLIYGDADNAGQYTFRAYNDNGTATSLNMDLGAAGSVVKGQWNQIVVVLDTAGGSTNASGYLNGVLVAGPTTLAGNGFLPNDGANANGLCVSTRGDATPTAGSYLFDGAVAEVAYYTNALDAGTVLAHYDAMTNASQYASLVQAQNPILYYQMDEQPLAPAAKNHGSLGDAANGYYQTGTAPGVAGPSFPGFPSTSLACQFDPNNSENTTETGPGVPCGAADAAMFNVTGSISLVAWVQISGPVYWYQDILGRGDVSFRLAVDSAGFPHFADDGQPDVIGAKTMNDGFWHLLVATYDADTGEAVLYMDGLESASTVYATPAVGMRELLLGGAPDHAAENFEGNLAHVAIFTNALTLSQVEQLSIAANGNVPPAPVLVSPLFPIGTAEGWSNSPYVFKPGVIDISGAPISYAWKLGSDVIPGATNATLAFASIPGVTLSNTYTLAMTATTSNGSVSSSVSLQYDMPPPAVVALYDDSFSRNGELSGSQPDAADVFSAVWGGFSGFTCNGSNVVTTSVLDVDAYLPFIPETNHVYVLSCDLNPMNSDDNWAAMGYGVGESPIISLANFGSWLLARGNRASSGSGAQLFAGPSTQNEQNATPLDSSGPSTYQIVLDTTSDTWAVSFWEDGILQDGPAPYSANLSINSVFMANYGTGNAAYGNFKLTDSAPPAAAPSIVQNPSATLFVLASFAASMRVTASGQQPLHYQWQFNGADVQDNPWLRGSQTNVLNVVAANSSYAGSYQLIVTNSFGSATSSVCAVAIGTLPLSLDGANNQGWSAIVQGGYYSIPSPILSNALELTDGNGQTGMGTAVGSECADVWFQVPQYIGAFKASFTFQAVASFGLADGASFILQNDPRGTGAEGTGGGTLGFAGYPPAGYPDISPSVGLLFNNYSPIGYSWSEDGNVNTPPQIPPGNVSLTSGDPINVAISYANGAVAITMADTVANTSFATNLVVGDITQVLGANTAYVGFGGSDGYYTSIQTISNFTFVSIPLNITATPTNTALITWPQTFSGYKLQQSANLSAPASWVSVTNQVQTLTNGMFQIVAPTTGSLFYRLAEIP